MAAPSDDDHELLRAFDAIGCPLNRTLQEMLNEHAKHCTERRGCGYTQATRHVAKHLNNVRKPLEYDEITLFLDRDSSVLRALLDGAAAQGVPFTWRNLDRRPPPVAMRDDPAWCALYEREAARQAGLRAVPERVEREESQVLARILRDLVLTPDPDPSLPALTPWPTKLEIGTCPLAEKYFLEIATGHVRRKGAMNVLVSDAGEPLLVEKLELGDSHSCITVAPVVINDAPLPPGSLLGVTYGGDVALRPNRELAGSVIPVSRCDGFQFLRLTTLAISPAHRERAFTSHYRAQLDGALYLPGKTTIQELLEQARKQL